MESIMCTMITAGLRCTAQSARQWDGGTMARDFAEAFYHSAQWRHCKETFISIRHAADGGMCERCHHEPGKIVHHRTHITPDNIGDPDITLNLDNLMYVCINCHNIIHGYAPDLPDRMIRYEFAPDGSPVARSPLKKC